MAARPDLSKLVGMSGWLALEDLEEACDTLRALGFEGIGVFHAQVASRLIAAPVYEGHYRAAGDVIREAGLIVSTLNVIRERDEFDPFGSDESRPAAAARLAADLRMAVAMGAPGVLIWDGRVDDEHGADAAPALLAECIERARDLAGLADPPEISLELHPFTFALKYGRLVPLAEALSSIGAGICVDFCHFGVALGPAFYEAIDDSVMAAVSEIHYSDTDCVTSEFHYPPGRGILDMSRVADRFAGRGVPASLDLFQWPAPRAAVRSSMEAYRDFVMRLSGAP